MTAKTDTETIDRRVNLWSLASSEAEDHFGKIAGARPTSSQIQTAACAILRFENPSDLLDRDWTGAELIKVLDKVDFSAWNDSETIALRTSIIPDGVSRRADEEVIKFRGEVWEIHKYDPDPFPHLPHAHCKYEGIKMDLRDGCLYRKRRFLGKVPKKRLLAFRDRVKRISLPDLTV
jgi:hypothetical protein